MSENALDILSLKTANSIHHQSFFQKFTMDAVLFLPLEGQLVFKATADLKTGA